VNVMLIVRVQPREQPMMYRNNVEVHFDCLVSSAKVEFLSYRLIGHMYRVLNID
jgi:hypothetical protein